MLKVPQRKVCLISGSFLGCEKRKCGNASAKTSTRPLSPLLHPPQRSDFPLLIQFYLLCKYLKLFEREICEQFWTKMKLNFESLTTRGKSVIMKRSGFDGKLPSILFANALKKRWTFFLRFLINFKRSFRFLTGLFNGLYTVRKCWENIKKLNMNKESIKN